MILAAHNPEFSGDCSKLSSRTVRLNFREYHKFMNQLGI